ncbi:hypothetical protein PMAYCL1PPCAC_07720, partial [Pristionchus mayeri]
HGTSLSAQKALTLYTYFIPRGGYTYGTRRESVDGVGIRYKGGSMVPVRVRVTGTQARRAMHRRRRGETIGWLPRLLGLARKRHVTSRGRTLEGLLGVGGSLGGGRELDDELVLLGGSSQTGDFDLGSRSSVDEAEDGLQTVLVVVRRLDLEHDLAGLRVGEVVGGGSSGSGDCGGGGFDGERHT